MQGVYKKSRQKRLLRSRHQRSPMPQVVRKMKKKKTKTYKTKLTKLFLRRNTRRAHNILHRKIKCMERLGANCQIKAPPDDAIRRAGLR